jgi:hypothetical protein
MKKLFTLLVLLVAIVTGAQAQTDFTLYGASAAPSLPITTDGITVSGVSTGSKNGNNQCSEISGFPSSKVYMISFSSGGLLTVDAGEGKIITSISMVVGRNSSGADVKQFGHGGFSNDQTTWSEIAALSAKGYDKGSKIDVTPTDNYRYYSFGRGKLGNTSPSANAEARVYTISVTVASAKTIVSQAFSGVKSGESTLAETTDYTVDGNTITFTASSATVPSDISLINTITYDDESSEDKDVAVEFESAAVEGFFVGTATIGETEYTVKVPVDSTPTLEADVASVSVVSNKLSTGTAQIQLTGGNLTGEASVAFESPVDGLTVSPATITVTDGTVNQQFTVSYQSAEDVAETTVNLVFKVGENKVEVPVTYSSTAAQTELESVSEKTTWNWDNLTPKSQIDLSADEVIMANLENLDFSNFAATQIALYKVQRPMYNSNKRWCAQAHGLKIKTTVPGIFSVKISGTNTNTRKLVVDGVESGTISATSISTFDNIPVSAGEHTLYAYEGENTNNFRWYEVTFTPLPASIDLTINAAAGATTVYSDYALDFSTLTNVKAYIETGTGDKLSWTQVNSAPAKTGLLVVSSETNLTVPTAASSETDVTGNRLKGVATGETKKVTDGDNIYIFTLHDGKPGFIKSNTNRSLLVGKAYLDLGEEATGAREFFELFEDGTTTGISSIDNDQLTTDNDAPAYNLAGQKVGKGYKGIVIINGKKVVK